MNAIYHKLTGVNVWAPDRRRDGDPYPETKSNDLFFDCKEDTHLEWLRGITPAVDDASIPPADGPG